MDELSHLLNSLNSASEADTVRRWWDRLADSDRHFLLAAYDERWEKCFFGPTPESDTTPTVLGGRFLPDDDAWGFGEWEEDWREYLVEHSEVSLMSNMFRSGSWLVYPGQLIIRVEWGWTRFQGEELPPSEQQRR
jgi:hypothetical protein